MGYGHHQSVKTVSHSFFAILEEIILRLLHFSSIHKGTYDTFYGWYCADFRRSLPVSVCGCTVLCPFPASCMESGHLRSRYQTSLIKGTEKLPFFEWEFLYLAFLGVSFLKILKHTMTYAIACSFSFTILFIFTVNAVKYI